MSRYRAHDDERNRKRRTRLEARSFDDVRDACALPPIAIIERTSQQIRDVSTSELIRCSEIASSFDQLVLADGHLPFAETGAYGASRPSSHPKF